MSLEGNYSIDKDPSPNNEEMEEHAVPRQREQGLRQLIKEILASELQDCQQSSQEPGPSG